MDTSPVSRYSNVIKKKSPVLTCRVDFKFRLTREKNKKGNNRDPKYIRIKGIRLLP